MLTGPLPSTTLTHHRAISSHGLWFETQTHKSAVKMYFRLWPLGKNIKWLLRFGFFCFLIVFAPHMVMFRIHSWFYARGWGSGAKRNHILCWGCQTRGSHVQSSTVKFCIISSSPGKIFIPLPTRGRFFREIFLKQISQQILHIGRWTRSFNNWCNDNIAQCDRVWLTLWSHQNPFHNLPPKEAMIIFSFINKETKPWQVPTFWDWGCWDFNKLIQNQ